MFTGTWKIVESQDLDEGYLDLESDRYVKLRKQGECISGEYAYGLCSGQIDGRLRGDEVLFSYEGQDEMHEERGIGVATVEGDRLTITFMSHMADDHTFECERVGR